jgi:HPt (histidine-containing phosphotransfer) domain-containing protein
VTTQTAPLAPFDSRTPRIARLDIPEQEDVTGDEISIALAAFAERRLPPPTAPQWWPSTASAWSALRKAIADRDDGAARLFLAQLASGWTVAELASGVPRPGTSGDMDSPMPPKRPSLPTLTAAEVAKVVSVLDEARKWGAGPGLELQARILAEASGGDYYSPGAVHGAIIAFEHAISERKQQNAEARAERESSVVIRALHEFMAEAKDYGMRRYKPGETYRVSAEDFQRIEQAQERENAVPRGRSFARARVLYELVKTP